MIHLDDKGAVRQDHYGTNRQPWDDILAQDWAPEFAAGNILKYLCRTKELEHSLESAKWYHARLTEMMRGELLPANAIKASARQRHIGRACAIFIRLNELLTDDEKVLLK